MPRRDAKPYAFTWPLAACALVLSLGVGGAVQAQTEAAAFPAAAAPYVTVARATMAEVVGEVPVTGTLVPREEVLVYPQVSGFSIEELRVQVGDRVVAGQVLATLDTHTLSVQVAQARAEMTRIAAAIQQTRSQIESARVALEQSQTQLDRVSQLRDSGAATQASLDTATAAAQTAQAAYDSAQFGLAVVQAQREQSQAQLDLAELNLDHASLRAPVAGVISARNGQIGAIATSGGEPIFRVISGGEIDAELEVIETAIGSITIGAPTTLRIASVGLVHGTVARISPTVDPRNRLATITIELEAHAGLRPGLFASGVIETARRMSLVVPTTAVQIAQDQAFVLAVVDGVVARKPVEAGLIWQEQREILSGLSAGDVVIARAGAFFSDGDVVNVVNPPDAGPVGAAQVAAAPADAPQTSTLAEVTR